MRRKVTGTERPKGGAPVEVTCVGGGCASPDGKLRPPEIPPRMCAPVVVGRLWRLTASQQWVTPGRGNHVQHFMTALLAPARCSLSKLVCHALQSGKIMLRGNIGCRMAGSSRQELELQENPCLCPRHSYEDVGRPQGLGDPVQANATDGPLGEGSAEAEGSSRESRDPSGREDEDETVSQSYHNTVLFGKLW